MPPINPQIRPRHKTAPARKQKHSRRFEVLRRSKASEQRAGHPCLLDLRLGGEESVCHCCADVLEEGVSQSVLERIGGRGWAACLLRVREC